MKKGYWIAHVDVTAPEKYEAYKALAPEAFAAFGGVYLARGGDATSLEGDMPGARHVVIEFPSYQAALDCYHSDLYQRARSERVGASELRLIILEGV